MSKLADCITAHGVQTHERLPEDVKAAVAAGDTALAVSTMQAHVAALKAVRKNIIDQVIQQIPATAYVTRGDADPTNELNTFQVKNFSIRKNLVQLWGKFSTAVKQLLSKPEQVTNGERAVFEHFMGSPDSFGRRMSQTINDIFKAKNGSGFKHRYEDMMQYLPVRVPSEFEHANLTIDEQHAKDHGILDPTVRSAIAATAYEWVAMNGRKSMAQTESSLSRLLGLQKDEPLPAYAFDLLEHAGINAETVAQQLGKVILQRLSIKSGPKSDALAQSRMEESLGFMALAAMEQMGVIERQYIVADRTDDARDELIGKGLPTPLIGLEALKAGKRLTKEELFSTNEGPNGPKGLLRMRLIRVVNKDLMIEIEDKFGKGREAFDKVFANEPQEFGMQWKAKARKVFKIGRSKIEANAEQTRNINKYNAIPYQRNPEAIAFLKSMWDLVEAQIEDTNKEQLLSVFYELLGAPPANNLLTLHAKNNAGIRRGIEQDFNDVLKYEKTHAERVDKGESTEFYLSSDFMANMRMIMRGDINPQNSKMHRSLFAPTGFKTTFTKNPKGTMDQVFLEAIAVAFDLETGKGLIGDAKTQIASLMDIMTNLGNDKHAAVRQAITAINQYHNIGKMTAEILKDIAAGSVAIDNKVTGLKGLFEYARYESTTNGAEFTTDMHAEIDGVSNGVIIGILQLLPDSAQSKIRDVLATLAMGGISTSNAKADLNKLLIKHNLNDAYQRMAQEWAKEILTLKKLWNTSGDKKHDGLFEQAQALGHILGEFQDEKGIINKTIRKLSKPRTMQIIYGAGVTKQIQLLTGENVIHEGIYKKVEKIIERVRKADSKNNLDPTIKADFEALMEDVRILTGSGIYRTSRYFTGVSKEQTIENLQGFYLPAEHIETLNKAVKDTYGEAMSNAIETVYGPLIEARKPLNTAVQLAVTTYNTILKKKVELLIESHKSDAEFKGDPEIITNEELDVILASIEHLIPKVKTPLHTKDSPSYLPMAEVGKNRSYTKQSKVIQQYLVNGLAQHQGYAEGIPYLEDPGVAPIIKTIHMLDSMVANGLMALDTHMLNNHDGFSHGIGDSEIIAQEANKIFAKVMTDYSLAAAFEDMHADLFKKGQDMLTELEVTSEAFLRGTSKNTDKKSAYTGGLINDKIISYDLLVSMKLANKDERSAFIKEQQTKKVPYNTAAQNYINHVIDTYIMKQKISETDFIKKSLEQLTTDIENITEQTTRNKKEITDSVRQWHQYPYHGKGYVVDNPVNTENTFFDKINTNTILTWDAKARDKDIETVLGFLGEGYSSSPTGSVSTTASDYNNPSQIVDRKNVTEVFDTTLDMENALGFASVQNSPSHIEYLRGVLNTIVARVMNPVEMFMDQHKINNETQGLYKVKEKQIWIQTQQRSDHPLAGMLGQGIRMSTAEVYAHELIHHIIHTGLKNFPNLQRQASALRELAFQQFTTKYGNDAFRVFMNDPTADIHDAANFAEVTAAKDRWEYVFNSKRNADGSNHGLDEFISFGMTNENFKRELGSLKVSDEIIKARKSLNTIFEKNIQQTIVNIFTMVLDFLYQRFNGQRHSAQVDQELENLVRALSYVDSKNKTVIWKFASDTEAAITAVSLKLDEKVVGLVKKGINSTAVGKAITELKKLPELDNMLSHQVRIALHWYTSQQQGFIPSVITEMQGTTERLRPLHDMIRMRRYVIDHAKNEARAVTQKLVNSWFQRKLTPAEKTAVTKALLKTDISYLLNATASNETGYIGSLAHKDAIIGYVADPNQREARITEILDQIKADPELKAYAHFFENAADDLGYFMVHSKRKADSSQPLMNAHNIVAMRQTKHAGKVTGDAFTRAVDLVEQLSTLSSLRYVTAANRQAAATVMQEDWSAIENVMTHHNILKKDAFDNLFHGNPVLMTKGYTKQILNTQIQVEMAHVANPLDPNDPTRKKFEDAGYYMMEKPLPRDPNDPVQDDIYMFKSPIGAVNDLQPGIMSYTQNIARGKVSYDIQLQMGNSINAPQVAEKNSQILRDHTLDVLDKMFLPRAKATQPTRPEKNYMIPQFNSNGDIAEMRYMMSEHTKDVLLEQFSEFDSILAAMTSQIVDKVATPKINKDLIIALKDMADKERKKYPEAYVEISPWSSEKRYRDIYQQLPPKAKTAILSVWGENRMWVAQDVVDLAFGQRKYTPSETFGKDRKSRNIFENMFIALMTYAMGGHNPLTEPPAGAVANNSSQGRTVRRVTNVFNTMAQLTKIGKANIVVRNLSVVFGNYQSNMAFLKSQGVPLEKIMLHNKEALIGVLQYQANKYELESWKSKLEIVSRKQSLTQADREIQVRNINRRIAVLENQIALNKVTPLVHAGAITTVIDDIETEHIQSPYKYGVDKALDKALDSLPPHLQKVGRVLFTTSDTEGYKMLNNAVQLTDFTGRYILYNHLLSKGVAKDAAMSEVMDKFINFDLPTHRMISMVNDIGLVMFSKYQLRVLKHIKNLLTEHPFTTLATYLITSNLMGGNNIINSIPGFTKELWQNVGDPFTLIATSPFDTVMVDGVQFAGGLAADVVTPD